MRSEVNSVFLAWQDPEKRSWHTVGELTQKDDLFEFHYTRGAQASELFIPFSGMNDLEMTYRSETLFPLFANRLLSKRRPEYQKMMSWLGLEENRQHPLTILAKTGGIKSTDNLQIFPEPHGSSENGFDVDFFVSGVGYTSESARQRIKTLNINDKLLLMRDFQNEHDSLALAIRTQDAPEIIGYCPRFLAYGLAEHLNDGVKLDVRVIRVNSDAPLYYQLMCTLRANAAQGEKVFNRYEFLRISSQSH